MCLEERRVGCSDGAKGTCLVSWGAEYSQEHYGSWERWMEFSTGSLWFGGLQRCCPVCGLLAVEQALLPLFLLCQC